MHMWGSEPEAGNTCPADLLLVATSDRSAWLVAVFAATHLEWWERNVCTVERMVDSGVRHHDAGGVLKRVETC